jgi:hypothetical protein
MNGQSAVAPVTTEDKYALAISADLDDVARLLDDAPLGQAARELADAVESARARELMMVCMDRLSYLLPGEEDTGKIVNAMDKLMRRLNGPAEEASATSGVTFQIVLPDGARMLAVGESTEADATEADAPLLSAGALVVDTRDTPDGGLHRRRLDTRDADATLGMTPERMAQMERAQARERPAVKRVKRRDKYDLAADAAAILDRIP